MIPLLIAAAVAGCAFVAGYVIGTAHGSIDNDSYWLGFADGELHQQLNDRTPSANLSSGPGDPFLWSSPARPGHPRKQRSTPTVRTGTRVGAQPRKKDR